MGELLATLFLSFIFMLVVGLIKPAYALPFIKQKTRKIVLLIYGLAIICVIIAMGINGNLTQEKDNDDRQDQGISNNVNEQIETKASNINEQAETKTSNINKEAQQLGENYLKKYFIKCGNNYFTLAHTHSDFFLQHKGPLKINFESFTLDDADEANGVEFRGSVKFDLEGLGRYYSFYSNVWKEWEHLQDTATVILEKKRGNWEPIEPPYSFREITCADVPAGWEK